MAANDRTLSIELGVVADQLNAGLTAAASQIRTFATEAVAQLNGAGRQSAGAFAPIAEGANAAGRAVSSFAGAAKGELEKVSAAGRNVGLVYQRIFEAFIGAEVVKQLFGMAVAADDLKLHFEQAAAIAGNLGHTFTASQIREYVEKLAVSAEGGGYAIDSMADAAQRFAGLGAGFQQIQYLLTTTSKLAAGLGIDYDRAAQLLERGAAGMEVSLRRVGISVKDAQGNFKSLDQIVAEINARFQDAAERRAASLAGQLGVVSNAAQRLRDEFGSAMAPALTLVLGGVEKLIDAIARLSPQVKTNIAIGVAFVAVLTTLGLIAGVLITALEALGSALAILTSPIGLVIAGIVALIAVFVEARTHPAQFHNALIAALNAARDSLDRFVDWVRRRFADLRQIFLGIVQLGAGNYAAGAALIGAGVDSTKRSFVDLGHTISTSIAGGFSAGVDAAKKAWTELQSFLKPKELGHAGGGPVSLAGIGNPPGAKGAGGGGAATNALDNLKSGIDSYLEGLAEQVDRAKQKVDLAKAALDLFKANEDPSAGKSLSDALAEQKLIGQQIAAQKEQQAAITAQILAKTAAEKAYENAARAVSPTLKNHDALVRSATTAAREQAKSVADLKVQWAEVGVQIAQGGLAIRTTWKEAFAEIARLQKDANQAILDTVDAARAAGEEGLFGRNEGRERSITDLEQQKALGQASGRGSALANAKLDVTIAQLRLAIAQDALTTAQHTAAVAHDADAIAQTKASRDAAVRADREVATATDQVTRATNALSVGMATLNKDLADTHFSFSKLLDGLEQKSGISRLGLEANPAQGANALAFNPLALLLNAFEQTRAFADIQKTVNELLKAFSQILDALKPVIDTLLRALLDVANGFIDVWNVIARIVRVLGIQLPILDQLNTDFSGLIPVIQVIHDIPTLNDLAAGRSGNLSNKPVDPSTLNAPVVQRLQSPTLGGGLFSVLLQIVGVLTAIRLIMIAIQAIQAAAASGGLFQGLLSAIGLGSAASAGGFGAIADFATTFLASSARRSFGGAASSVGQNLGGGGQAGTAPPGGGDVTLNLAITTGDVHGIAGAEELGNTTAETLSRALGLTRYGFNRTAVLS